jgi:AraC family transcriptional regulator
MAAHPAFEHTMQVALEGAGAARRQGAECRFCRGTGRAYIGHDGGSPSISGFPRYMMRRIEELLESRLQGRHPVAELASTMGYSTSHFFRMFRRSFGITPHTYVMRRRLAMAQELLLRTDRCLAEIALNAGFCDQAHLSRTFRRSVGTTPRAFRAINRSAGDEQGRCDAVC